MSAPLPERLIEALLFASDTPLGIEALAARLPEGTDVRAILRDLGRFYEGRGVALVETGGGWAFRTAADLGSLLSLTREVPRKLSRAAVEALAIIAYHQPVTRGEVEEIRGVQLSKGTMDVLLEAGWIKPRGRRMTPGRPITWGTTPGFLDHFGLTSLDDLPGVDELKAAGLLDRRPSVIAMRAEEADPDLFSGDDNEPAQQD
ncbi:SMC-Scp complex subunit ScpB [Lacibacterium aquatile]|uniref:SMC-Scp complex subunit ScpB n=1 Tax=Lacibacterium aquatile TaxID=1168082 RepID=A0ABW5DNK8_9PROT